MSPGDEARLAIARGVGFLARRQLPTGELAVRTSLSPAMTDEGTPDPAVFPTAVIANALADVPAAAAVRDRALDFLTAEMHSPGLWKHWPRAHPHAAVLPFDLDDTAVASQALARSGRPLPANRRLLLDNRDRRGLFRTWLLPRPSAVRHSHRALLPAQLRHPLGLVMFFRRTSAAPSDVDAVVNANVVSYLGVSAATQPVVEHLVDVLRSGTESQCDKWYESPAPVWYAFSRALHRTTPEAGDLIVDRLSATTPRDDLARALHLSCHLLWGRAPDIGSVRRLIGAQTADGSWPRAAYYFGGRTRLPDGTFAPPHPDTPRWGSEELTTAMTLEALSHWLRVSAA